MKDDAFRKLLLRAALAVDQQLCRLIVKLADDEDVRGEGAEKKNDDAKDVEVETASPSQSISGSAGPPKHWIDLVKNRAPELLLPKASQYFFHDSHTGKHTDGVQPWNSDARETADRPKEPDIGEQIEGHVAASRERTPAATAPDTPGYSADKGEASRQDDMSVDAAAGPVDFSQKGNMRRFRSDHADAGTQKRNTPSPHEFGHRPVIEGAFDASSTQSRRHPQDSKAILDAKTSFYSRHSSGAGASFPANANDADVIPPPASGIGRRGKKNDVGDTPNRRRSLTRASAGEHYGVREPPSGSDAGLPFFHSEADKNKRYAAHKEDVPQPEAMLPGLDGGGTFNQHQSLVRSSSGERFDDGRLASKPYSKRTFFYAQTGKGKQHTARKGGAHWQEAMLAGLDGDALEPDNQRWPQLPDENPSQIAAGFEQSGRWPLLPDELRLLESTEDDLLERGELAATPRKNERLERLEKEQAGGIWSVRPF